VDGLKWTKQLTNFSKDYILKNPNQLYILFGSVRIVINGILVVVHLQWDKCKIVDKIDNITKPMFV
jgi:hypothetical protein